MLLRQLLEELALAGGELGGEDNLDAGDKVAGAVALEAGHALTAQAEGLTVLCLGRDGEQQAFAVRRGDGRLAAEDGGGERHGDVGLEVVAFALEAGVGLDADDEDEVAARPAADAGVALAGNGYTRTGVGAGGDLHLDTMGTQDG